MKKIRTYGAAVALSAMALSLAALPAGVAGASAAKKGSAPAGAGKPAFTLQGEATIVNGGIAMNYVETVSDPDPGFGAILFDVVPGTTYADIGTLSADFNVTDDDCGAASPRFQISVDTDKNGTSDGVVQAFLGPQPSGFTDCTPGWQNTGNLIGNSEPGRFDYTLVGGVLGTYADAPATVKAANVLSVRLLTDGGWNDAGSENGDGEQTIWFDNVNIDGIVYDFENVRTLPAGKDQCKKDGWKKFTGKRFRNQGDCVSYANHAERLARQHGHHRR